MPRGRRPKADTTPNPFKTPEIDAIFAGADKPAKAKKENGPLGFEAKLWAAADALRNNMDAAEYKHVVLGLIFLKYISDAFEAKHAELAALKAEGADAEDPDEYRAVNIFWVPPEARWAYLKSRAPQPTIGRLVDDAMEAIERDNPPSRAYCRRIRKARVSTSNGSGRSSIWSATSRLATPPTRAKDTLGRVYEYFLSRFASAEGKSGGQFYTPTPCRARTGRNARAL